MENILGVAARKTLTATERKVADAKAEREFDLALASARRSVSPLIWRKTSRMPR